MSNLCTPGNQVYATKFGVCARTQDSAVDKESHNSLSLMQDHDQLLHHLCHYYHSFYNNDSTIGHRFIL